MGWESPCGNSLMTISLITSNKKSNKQQERRFHSDSGASAFGHNNENHNPDSPPAFASQDDCDSPHNVLHAGDGHTVPQCLVTGGIRSPWDVCPPVRETLQTLALKGVKRRIRLVPRRIHDFSSSAGGCITRSVASLCCRALSVLATSFSANTSTRWRLKTAWRSAVVRENATSSLMPSPLPPLWGFRSTMFPDIQKAVGGSSTSGTLFPPVPHRAEIVGDTSWGPVYRASMPWFSCHTPARSDRQSPASYRYCHLSL